MNPVDYTGIRGLWSAVILQAFVDLRLHTYKNDMPIIKATGNMLKDKRRLKTALIHRNTTKKEWARARSDALNWIFSNDTHPQSFLWICECLDFDANYLRSMASSCEGIEKVLKGKGRGK